MVACTEDVDVHEKKHPTSQLVLTTPCSMPGSARKHSEQTLLSVDHLLIFCPWRGSVEDVERRAMGLVRSHSQRNDALEMEGSR